MVGSAVATLDRCQKDLTPGGAPLHILNDLSAIWGQIPQTAIMPVPAPSAAAKLPAIARSARRNLFGNRDKPRFLAVRFAPVSGMALVIGKVLIVGIVHANPVRTP